MQQDTAYSAVVVNDHMYLRPLLSDSPTPLSLSDDGGERTEPDWKEEEDEEQKEIQFDLREDDLKGRVRMKMAPALDIIYHVPFESKMI